MPRYAKIANAPDNIPRPIYSVLKDHIPDLVPGTKFDLSGLVNAEPKPFFVPKYNSVVIRIPILTYDHMQILCEVWCCSREQEPRYNLDWRHFQFTLIRGAIFKEKVDAYGIEVYVFKVSSSNREHRFFWISDPARDFWSSPVNDPELHGDFYDTNIQRHDGSNVRGIINASFGCCFGRWVSEKDRKIHTHQIIGGLNFDGWKQFMIECRRKLTRAFITDMMMEDNNLVYKRSSPPLFHRLVLS